MSCIKGFRYNKNLARIKKDLLMILDYDKRGGDCLIFDVVHIKII